VDDVNLTTQQKSRFRRAYRDTFGADNHGDAVKQLYSKYAELYGVSVDSLRAIVAGELKKKPEEYAALRSALAARQSDKPRPQAQQLPAKSKKFYPSKNVFETFREPDRKYHGDGLRKRRLKHERKLIAEGIELQRPVRQIAPRHVVSRKCPRCGGKFTVEWNGQLAKHRSHGAVCSGKAKSKRTNGRGGTKDQQKATCVVCRKKLGVRQSDGRMLSHAGTEGVKCSSSGRSPFEGRGSRYMKGLAATAVVSGGLPGLGKRR